MHTEDYKNKKYNETIKLINEYNPIYNIINHIKNYTNLTTFIMFINNKKYESVFKIFISLCDIDYDLFMLLITQINKSSKGNYKQVYCNEYKLILILELRNNVVKWKDLTKSIFYNPIDKSKNNFKLNNYSKYHYKSINAQYIRWCQNDIFKNTFMNIIPYNNINNEIDDNENDDYYIINSDNDLFIDSCYINNKLGSELIVINPELTKKKVTKISTISNIDGFIYSVITINSKDKEIIFNKEKRTIKTTNNDSKTIQQTVDNINNNIIIKSNNINLIGDKGYKTDDEIKMKNNKLIKIITPNKSNQKNKLIKRSDSKKLGYRYIIENTICSFKKDERINLRKDRKISTFIGWIYLSCLSHNLKTNKRIKNNLIKL